MDVYEMWKAFDVDHASLFVMICEAYQVTLYKHFLHSMSISDAVSPAAAPAVRW